MWPLSSSLWSLFDPSPEGWRRRVVRGLFAHKAFVSTLPRLVGGTAGARDQDGLDQTQAAAAGGRARGLPAVEGRRPGTTRDGTGRLTAARIHPGFLPLLLCVCVFVCPAYLSVCFSLSLLAFWRTHHDTHRRPVFIHFTLKCNFPPKKSAQDKTPVLTEACQNFRCFFLWLCLFRN